MRRPASHAAVVALAMLLHGMADAHSISTSYLQIDGSATGAPTLQWRIALRDLDALLELDTNGDAELTWGEVADRGNEIAALAASRLVVSSGSQACTIRFQAPRYARLAEAGYAQLDGTASCSGGAAASLQYRLFEGVDPSHRALLTTPPAVQSRIVAPGATVGLSAAEVQGFSGFLSSGIAHIAGGLDHLLFLLTLLLPAVLQWQRTPAGPRWVARDSVESALLAVIWIATAFTIAHSITLALATFGVVRIPAHVIEPLIALTIVAAALNNVWPLVTNRLPAVAFAFGLIHGFGFAEVLAPLSLPRAELAAALLGFNLGVEIGQIAIVTAALVVLAPLRRWPGYPRWILTLGSLLIAVVAALWFFERAFGVSVIA